MIVIFLVSLASNIDIWPITQWTIYISDLLTFPKPFLEQVIKLTCYLQYISTSFWYAIVITIYVCVHYRIIGQEIINLSYFVLSTTFWWYAIIFKVIWLSPEILAFSMKYTFSLVSDLAQRRVLKCTICCAHLYHRVELVTKWK